MKINVITYGSLDQRLAIVKAFLADMAERGTSVQLVHPSIKTARALEAALDTPVLSSHDFSFSVVDADCIAVLDGDIMDARTAKRIEFLRKPAYLLVPNDAFSAVADHGTLKELLEGRELVPRLRDDEDQPRTFACHHNTETCGSCEWLVMDWKADRRDRAAPIMASLSRPHS